MMNNMTQTPIVPMEKENALREGVHRRVAPIFEAALPQETSSDSMAIRKVFYRPNNFRRQTSFALNTDSPILGAIRKEYGCGSKGLVFVEQGRVLLQFGRTKLTAVWNQRVNGKKEVFSYEGSAEQIVSAIMAKKDEIRAALDSAIMGFAVKHQLIVKNIIWERAEEWIKGEDYLDALPRDLILHDTVFKKVYEDGGEFLTKKGGEAGVHVKHFIKNRALEEFSPEIVKALELLAEKVAGVDPLQRVKERVNVYPDDLLRPDVQVLIGGLNLTEKAFLSDWLFERFGR